MFNKKEAPPSSSLTLTDTKATKMNDDNTRIALLKPSLLSDNKKKWKIKIVKMKSGIGIGIGKKKII